MRKICPCGTPLERKKYESDAALEKRDHCDVKCRAKYYKPKPAERGFGIELPKDKTILRTGRGIMAYLYNKPV